MVQVPCFVKHCLKDFTLIWQFGTSITMVFLRTWDLLLLFLCISRRYRKSLIFRLPHILSCRWGACSAFPVSLKMFPMILTRPSPFFTHWVYPENQTAFLRFAACISSPPTHALSFCTMTSTPSNFWNIWSQGVVAAYDSRTQAWRKGIGTKIGTLPYTGKKSSLFIITAHWQAYLRIRSFIKYLLNT